MIAMDEMALVSKNLSPEVRRVKCEKEFEESDCQRLCYHQCRLQTM